MARACLDVDQAQKAGVDFLTVELGSGSQQVAQEEQSPDTLSISSSSPGSIMSAEDVLALRHRVYKSLAQDPVPLYQSKL